MEKSELLKFKVEKSMQLTNKKVLLAFALTLISSLYTPPTRADKSAPYRPASIPVSIKTTGEDASRAGIGYTNVDVISKWEDNFFSSRTEEIGELKYTSHNLAIGVVKKTKDRSAREIDISLGYLKGEEKTTTYYSNNISKQVDVDYKGNGLNLGARYLSSTTLFQWQSSGSGIKIDWDFAYSLHAAIFSIKSDISATSRDGLDRNVYKEESYGLFIRPVVAFWPNIRFNEYFSISPFVGIGTKLTGAYYYWEDSAFVRNGITGINTDDDDFKLEFTGISGMTGIDLAIMFNKKSRHEVSLGGVISKVVGKSEADFAEFHLLYTFPY